MYKILIENLEIEAIIGLLEHERENEQKLIIDCKIEYEDKKFFVDYAKVVDIITKTIKAGRFLLLEDALDEIEKNILKNFQIKTLYIKIIKPEILKNAFVGVEILRKY